MELLIQGMAVVPEAPLAPGLKVVHSGLLCLSRSLCLPLACTVNWKADTTGLPPGFWMDLLSAWGREESGVRTQYLSPWVLPGTGLAAFLETSTVDPVTNLTHSQLGLWFPSDWWWWWAVGTACFSIPSTHL